jgi:hypothetical protein
LNEFRSAIDVRDLLEHFDAYTLGVGYSQRAARKRGDDPDPYWFAFGWSRDLEHGTEEFSIFVGPQLRLDVTKVSEAAFRLADRVTDALEQLRDRDAEWEAALRDADQNIHRFS